jgi:hypothetical protein
MPALGVEHKTITPRRHFRDFRIPASAENPSYCVGTAGGYCETYRRRGVCPTDLGALLFTLQEAMHHAGDCRAENGREPEQP